MKLTDKDMDHPAFWRIIHRAKAAVKAAVGDDANIDDKAAKAMADAVDTLAKAMLLAQKVDA